MADQGMSSKPRKPYRKPRIEQVKLVPEEAVLSACKTLSGGGENTTGNCMFDGDPDYCIDVGS